MLKNMKIFTKSKLNIKELNPRRFWNVDGLETYLEYKKIDDLKLIDRIKWCSDNFETVSFETGDRLYGITPTDLLEERTQAYIEKTLNLMSKIINAGILVVHLAGSCKVGKPPYKRIELEQKTEILNKCIEYINIVDPKNKIIALENTFPTDWMNEDKGIISFYPFGKISSDFGDRIRTFDIAHGGISAYTYSKLIKGENNYTYLDTEFGKVPVYFSEEEKEIVESAKKNLTDAVCDELRRANVVNVHFNANKGLLDGFGINEKSDLDLQKIAGLLKGKNICIVAEVKERRTNDYFNAPNQREMIKFLKEYFQ